MKSLIKKAVSFTVFAIPFLSVYAQKNYYVVVSAFSADSSMNTFTTRLPSFNSDTAYTSYNQQNVMQLYVWHTTSRDAALSKSIKIQGELEKNVSQVTNDSESLVISNEKNLNQKDQRSKKAEGIKLNFNENLSNYSFAPGATNIDHILKPLATKEQHFKFTITNEAGLPVEGKIHQVDYSLGKELAAYPPDSYTTLFKPRNKETALTCGIFGYKFEEKYADLEDPVQIEGAYRDETGAWVIPYRLRRMEKGDVSVMYHVAFHKDAVIMMSPSQKELDELVRMMKENPYYEITIHGHCNGRNHRKIIAMGAEQQFFDMKGSHEIYGSARMLSDLRSHAVKIYLTEHGIDEYRIKTYAWGGSYMLIDKDSPYAKLNDRIEIEIRKD